MANGQGDFEVEVEAAYPALLRAAIVLCRSRSDVEDVVQETLLRAFKAYSSFKGESSFFTWAYTILARAAAATNGRQSRLLPPEYGLDRGEQLPPIAVGLLADEHMRAAVDAIRSLPQRQRQMAALHFLEELSYKDIAAALGVSVGTVKATIFAAKMSLRSALAKKNIWKGTFNVLS